LNIQNSRYSPLKWPRWAAMALFALLLLAPAVHAQ
jgi:hypothetical protein